jgi:glycosyltransferase involved in cell wall biosynthesis
LPRISVIIPVFNRADTIGTAVTSVLSQTVLDLEIIVVDDGSTDGSAEAVNQVDDGRVRIIRLEENCGIPKARNTGLEAASTEYVAWLDSDDLARPTQLERQLDYLIAHPDVAFVGACAGKICWRGQRRLGVRVPPLEHEDIAAWLLFRSAFQNSAVTGRTEVFQRYPYRSQYPVCEDIDQFQRIAAEHRTANLPSALIDRRLHKGQIIRERVSDMQRLKVDLFANQLDRLGVHAGPDDIARHVQLGNPKLPIVDADRDFLSWAEEWLARLARANRASRMVDEQAMSLAGSFFWARACAEAVPLVGWAHAGQRLVTAEPGRRLGAARARRWLGNMLKVQVTSSLSEPHARERTITRDSL